MKDLKSLLFKEPNSIYANVFIQSLDELIQKGNDVTKEKFEGFLGVIPKELLNENIDINAAYSQFITEFVKKNNTSSKQDDTSKDNTSSKQDDTSKDNNNHNSDKETISKEFYAQIENICLNKNLTFDQTINQLNKLKKDYHDKYSDNFVFVEKQIKIVDDLIKEIESAIQVGVDKIKEEIANDDKVKDLDTTDLEKELYDRANKEIKVTNNDKITEALLEKGRILVVDTFVRKLKPIEDLKRTVQDIKMDSSLREIEKIEKILQIMKSYENADSEINEEIKKLEDIKRTYSQRKADFSNQLFMNKAKAIANKDRKKIIEKMDQDILKVLNKKFTDDKLKTDKYKSLLNWENTSKLVDELKEDIIKNSNLEGISEIKKIETYIHFYEDELDKDENTEIEIQNMKAELDKLKDIYQSYISAFEDISNSISKAIAKDKSFENLNSRGKERKVNQMIDGNLNLYDAVKNFDRWDNPEQLKMDLKNDIYKEILDPKKEKGTVKNNGKDINKWQKALIGSLGFVTGIGLNVALKSHPVLGAVATAYTLARTVYNASKLTCSISTKINKGNEPKIISGIKSVIPAKVQNIAKTIFEKPSNPYFRSFVNGLSLGYTSANIYQRFIAPQPDTTVTVVDEDKLTAPTPTETPTPTPSASVTETVTTAPKVTTTPTATVTTTPVASTTPSAPDIPTFKTGNVMDISGLEYGYAGPGQPAVHLLNNRGVNAVFDKTNVINGQTWVHFKQANGAGYAWFPKEEVEEMLTSVSSGRAR